MRLQLYEDQTVPRVFSHNVNCSSSTMPTQSHHGRGTSRSCSQSHHQSVKFPVSRFKHIPISVFTRSHVPRSLLHARFLREGQSTLKTDRTLNSLRARDHREPYQCPHFYTEKVISRFHAQVVRIQHEKYTPGILCPNNHIFIVQRQPFEKEIS
jgi:hypothetical protein